MCQSRPEHPARERAFPLLTMSVSLCLDVFSLQRSTEVVNSLFFEANRGFSAVFTYILVSLWTEYMINSKPNSEEGNHAAKDKDVI